MWNLQTTYSITKTIQKRREAKQETPQPTKTSETRGRQTSGHNFRAPGHHFDVILSSFWASRRPMSRLWAPSASQVEQKSEMFQTWNDIRVARAGPGEPRVCKRPQKRCQMGAAGCPKASQKWSTPHLSKHWFGTTLHWFEWIFLTWGVRGPTKNRNKSMWKQ